MPPSTSSGEKEIGMIQMMDLGLPKIPRKIPKEMDCHF
jgi:hypothetical protein